MTIQEVTAAFLATIPTQPPRPAHISDREFAETYRSLLRSIEAEKNGETGTVVSLAELQRKLTGNG